MEHTRDWKWSIYRKTNYRFFRNEYSILCFLHSFFPPLPSLKRDNLGPDLDPSFFIYRPVHIQNPLSLSLFLSIQKSTITIKLNNNRIIEIRKQARRIRDAIFDRSLEKNESELGTRTNIGEKLVGAKLQRGWKAYVRVWENEREESGVNGMLGGPSHEVVVLRLGLALGPKWKRLAKVTSCPYITRLGYSDVIYREKRITDY